MGITREIPEAQWGEFLRRMTREYEDRPIRIEVENLTLGQQEMGDHLILQEFQWETAGSGRGQMEISVEGPFSHRVAEPVRMWAAESEDGRVSSIEIEDAQKTRTRIYFEAWMVLAAEEATPVVP